MKYSTKWFLLIGVTLAAAIALLFIPPIPQSPEYHDFADQAIIAGIPNFWNMVTNIPFLIVGAWGFILLRRQWKEGRFSGWKEIAPYFTMVSGVFLTGLGSAYYHWAPNNATLIWDRLPMTLIFMSLVSVILTERVGEKIGLWSLGPLLVLGIGSVLYWSWTESLGRGDLRPYAFVQFYPPVFIVLVLCLFRKPASTIIPKLGWAFLFYGLAKFFELNDGNIQDFICFIGGHPVKHVLAAISAGWLVSIIAAGNLSTIQPGPPTDTRREIFKIVGGS